MALKKVDLQIYGLCFFSFPSSSSSSFVFSTEWNRKHKLPLTPCLVADWGQLTRFSRCQHTPPPHSSLTLSDHFCNSPKPTTWCSHLHRTAIHRLSISEVVRQHVERAVRPTFKCGCLEHAKCKWVLLKHGEPFNPALFSPAAREILSSKNNVLHY